ncbi:MAG: helix-turn-helix domain-containing protein [Chloroflexota bacterium]|nr:helix-turn-helix domain-containing protein [Chloroflexota bacterium]
MLGDLLRRYRVDSGLTQEDLAERAAISARTVSDIERGLRSRVYRDTARRLADALQLDPPRRAAFERAARPTPLSVLQRVRIAPSAAPFTSSVPAPLTRLIGRDAELAAVVAALRSGEMRVVTLVGPGGIGKTRLALEAARELAGSFADGAHFVSLAVTGDPSLVPSLVARQLGLASVRKPMEEALRDLLRERDMLLVLDTFEQVLAAAVFVADLAVTCPRLAFLVTSRAALRIRGEHEIPLAALAMPELAADVAELERYPATALFLERARAVKPGLAVDSASVVTVVQICRRLDGLPLAIELAAVRLRYMPLAVLQAALDRRLNVLVGGPRDVPPRHQTMRNAIAWSHELLPSPIQRLFRTLSVFAGGWTLTAAESIFAAGHGLDEEMATLVDNNLIAIDEGNGDQPRFRMLDVIREFATEQAAAQAETEDLSRRHAALFANLAEAAERAQGDASQEAQFRRLQVEQDNMRAALVWAVAHKQGVLAQRISGALWLFWRRHGDYTEARQWLDRALALPASIDEGRAARRLRAVANPESDSAIRRKALWGDAWISYYQGDYPRVRQLGDELLQLARDDRDPVGTRNGLTIQALVAMAEREFGNAIGLLEEALTICRQSCPPWLLATSLLVLGQATLHRPDLVRSQDLLNEALSIYARLGDLLFVARTKSYLGYALLLEGRADAARRLLVASLKGFRDLDEPFGIAEQLQAMAALRASEERDELAAELAGAAHAMWATMSAQALAPDRPIADRYLDLARRRLGSAAWRSAWRRGNTMDVDVAVGLALRKERMVPARASKLLNRQHD